MTVSDVWRDVGKRIGFFTKETSHAIPEEPGVYAWFLPLWLYSESLDELVRFVQSAYLFDAEFSASPDVFGQAVRSCIVEFNWESASIRLERAARCAPTEHLSMLWHQMLADGDAKQAFSQALMEATLFTRPLYVGKADNLLARYLQHTDESNTDKNEFRSRFGRFIQASGPSLRVADLLFVCIRTAPETSRALREHKLNYLLEQVLMQLVCPPFSCR